MQILKINKVDSLVNLFVKHLLNIILEMLHTSLFAPFSDLQVSSWSRD